MQVQRSPGTKVGVKETQWSKGLYSRKWTVVGGSVSPNIKIVTYLTHEGFLGWEGGCGCILARNTNRKAILRKTGQSIAPRRAMYNKKGVPELKPGNTKEEVAISLPDKSDRKTCDGKSTKSRSRFLGANIAFSRMQKIENRQIPGAVRRKGLPPVIGVRAQST